MWFDYMRLFGGINTRQPADRLLSDGDEIKLDGLKINILHTPGHTPARYIAGDRYSAEIRSSRQHRRMTRRRKLEELKRSLHKRPSGDCRLYPGHGSSTHSIERGENSYLNMQRRWIL